MDLGTSPGWFNSTKSYLDGNPDTDVVVWSWCGQQSSNSDAVVQAYLSNMSVLETQYPNVRFIYMTGHLRGAYSEYLYDDAGNAVLQHNNQTVRDYCTAHDKWFFDFADIESYRDGSSEQCRYNGMPSECDWQSSVTGCAHSRMPNCIRKGNAFYWLLARITGWEG